MDAPVSVILIMVKAQCCVHKGQMCARWISITLWFFRSMQICDKYTSTKYPPQLMLFASVMWLPIHMYNTTTIWYTTMYHETSVVFNTQEPSVERPSPSNIGLRQGYHSHQEQYWTKKKEKKKKFAFSWNRCKCFTRVHNFVTDSHLNVTDKNKTKT